MRDATRATEAELITEALARHDFDRIATAHALGIHKSTLFRKMARLGLDVPRTARPDGRSRTKARHRD